MSNKKEPIRVLECTFDDNGHPSWAHSRLIKIAKSEAGVIYHHICLVLLYLYTVLTRQESGIQLRRINFVKV
jgi:hypothetical protein